MTHELLRADARAEGFDVDDIPVVIASPDGNPDEDVVDITDQLGPADADELQPRPLPDPDVFVGSEREDGVAFDDGIDPHPWEGDS